jgi:hypothetical protein
MLYMACPCSNICNLINISAGTVGRFLGSELPLYTAMLVQTLKKMCTGKWNCLENLPQLSYFPIVSSTLDEPPGMFTLWIGWIGVRWGGSCLVVLGPFAPS